MAKTEKIEFSFIEDMQSLLNFENDVDVEKMFSVGKKMHVDRKKVKFVTHARAIRDAISHKKYKILEEGHGPKKIVFRNTEYGYNFEETFTVEEFLEYIRGTDMLYRIMFMMINLHIFTNLLHFSID